MLLAGATILVFPTLVRADQITVLHTASTYGVLAASTITSSGSTTVTGNLGLTPGTSVTGVPPISVTSGTTHIGDSDAVRAQADALAGYNSLWARTMTQSLTGEDLGGRTLHAGVYRFNTTAALTGDLTLDFDNVSNVDIVFQVGTSFASSAGSTITVIHQGTKNNVYYVIGSSATLGATSVFAGDILAYTSISLGTGAGSSCGSLIALGGAVTMLSNEVNHCSSSGSNVPAASRLVQDVSAVPEPGTFAMVATGMAGATGAWRRKRFQGISASRCA